MVRLLQGLFYLSDRTAVLHRLAPRQLSRLRPALASLVEGYGSSNRTMDYLYRARSVLRLSSCVPG